MSGRDDIMLEASNYFATKFHENNAIRPTFINHNFKVLHVVDRDWLDSPFELREVKNAIWDCDGEKAPGPDGFNFKFIKKFWSLMQDGIMCFVKHLESYGCLSRRSNPSFISLLPNVKDPLTLAEFRPISLIGCVYKNIVKVLASRIKKVIGAVIDETQTAFVHGRNILDAPMIINEVYTWAKKFKRRTFLFKVDFEKAFNSINWGYLESVMSQMGLGDKWRFWIRGCLSSSRASVLINGTATKDFPITKGVRQGDPLSPFIFIIAMEGLNVAIKTACLKELFKGVDIPNNGPYLSHLFYAGDAIFIGNWATSDFVNLARILRCFHVSSGLKVNFHKSKVFGISVSDGDISSCARIMGYEALSFPFTYLGVPVGANISLKRNLKPITEKMRNKLSSWKVNSFSFGRRVTLIKSVLSSLPLYFPSLFKAPKSILKELEKLRRSFLWGYVENKNKLNSVAWKTVIGPKDIGGLGIGSIQSINFALLLKWIWRFKMEPKSL